MSGFLSPLWYTWLSLCGIGRNSVKTAYHLKPIQYSIDLVEPRSDKTKTLFSAFYNYFGSRCSGLLFTERFDLPYRKLYLFLKIILHLLVGVSAHYHGLSLCALYQRPSLICAYHHCNCLRIPSDSLIFIRL